MPYTTTIGLQKAKVLLQTLLELLVSSVFSESYKGSSKIIKSGKVGYLEDCNTEHII